MPFHEQRVIAFSDETSAEQQRWKQTWEQETDAHTNGRSLLIKDGRVGVADEIRRYNIIIVVSDDSSHLVLGGILERSADSVVISSLIKTSSKINNIYVSGRYTERHTSKFSIDLRGNLSYSLGSSGARWDDDVTGCTSSSPVLLGRSVNSLLGGSDGVDSGHETLGDSELVIDNFGKRGKTVGAGTRGVGNNIHGVLVLFLVNSHDKHGSISGRSRDDNLLGASLNMSGSSLCRGEDTSGRIDNIISTNQSTDLTGVHLS